MGNQQSTLLDEHLRCSSSGRGAGEAGGGSGLDFLAGFNLNGLNQMLGGIPSQQPLHQQQHKGRGGGGDGVAVGPADLPPATPATTSAAQPSGPAGSAWSFLAPAAAAVFNSIAHTPEGWGESGTGTSAGATPVWSSPPSCSSPATVAASAAAAAAAAADKEAAALAAAALAAMPARSLAQPAFELPPPNRMAAQLKGYGVDPTADLSLTSLMWRAAAAAASDGGGGRAGAGEEQEGAVEGAEGTEWELGSGLEGLEAVGYGEVDVAPAGPQPVVAGVCLGPPLLTDGECGGDRIGGSGSWR